MGGTNSYSSIKPTPTQRFKWMWRTAIIQSKLVGRCSCGEEQWRGSASSLGPGLKAPVQLGWSPSPTTPNSTSACA